MSFDTSIRPLGEIVSVKGGKRLPKGAALQSTPTSHPYIRVRDMGHRYIPSKGLEFVSDEIFPKIKRYIVEENDVIISIVGTIGLVSIIDERFHLASQTENAAKLTGLDFFDAHYLYYYLTSHAGQQEIQKGTIGAVQPKLPLYNIAKIQVPWPKRNVRFQIVSQLVAIDDKVQVNHQINQTLEQMAQALFKCWFVDFEPVKAKIAARERWQALQPENECASPVCYAAEFDEMPAVGDLETYMNRAAMQAISGNTAAQLDALRADDPERYDELYETAALFPSAMQDSELGEIPEGWGTGTLQNLCIKIESGGTPKRKVSEYWGGDIKWLSSGEVRNPIALETKETITKAGLKDSSAKLWPNYTTVVAMYGATAGQVCLLADEMTSNQACCGLVPKRNCKTYLFINAKRSVQTFIGKASGSAQQNLNKSLVSRHEALLPPETVLTFFEKLAFPLIRNWIESSREARVLSSLRDTLLPKLLSGELTIPDAEARMAEVADA